MTSSTPGELRDCLQALDTHDAVCRGGRLDDGPVDDAAGRDHVPVGQRLTERELEGDVEEV